MLLLHEEVLAWDFDVNLFATIIVDFDQLLICFFLSIVACGNNRTALGRVWMRRYIALIGDLMRKVWLRDVPASAL